MPAQQLYQELSTPNQSAYGNLTFTEDDDERDVTVELELIASAALMDNPGWRVLSISTSGRRATVRLRAEDGLG